MVQELLPWARQNYSLTRNPADTVVGGLSLGGVAAASAALQHPETFGNVLTQSGAFGNGREGECEEEWIARQVATREIVPVRFYLEAGLLENQRDTPHISILRANRHLRTVLQAKGYSIQYTEYSGGHQPLCWRGTLSTGLVALLGRNR
jgi:enterochelin esterase family protein